MKQGLSFFLSHLSICVTEHETDGCEEIALAGAIATNNNIVLRGEGFDNGLIFVAASQVSLLLRVTGGDTTYLLNP